MLKQKIQELEERLKKYTHGDNHKRYYKKNKDNMTTELEIPTHKDCMKKYLFIKKDMSIKICINIIIHIYKWTHKKKEPNVQMELEKIK